MKEITMYIVRVVMGIVKHPDKIKYEGIFKLAIIGLVILAVLWGLTFIYSKQLSGHSINIELEFK